MSNVLYQLLEKRLSENLGRIPTSDELVSAAVSNGVGLLMLAEEITSKNERDVSKEIPEEVS